MDLGGPPQRSADLIRVVSRTEELQRLDLFLARCHPDLSRNQFRKLILGGRVLVQGRRVKPSYELRAGEEVSAWFSAHEPQDQLVPECLALDILFEDEDLLVLNKAPGMVVHPGAGHTEGTLVHGLLAHCPRLAVQGAPKRPGIVHRLDRNTSGVMVVAKSERAYLGLIGQFKEHAVRKEYQAFVLGKLPEISGCTRTFLGRHPVERKKMAVLSTGGKEAITEWHVLAQWEEISLVKVLIRTGRTHQIRVHFSHMRHPVVGDSTYGGGKHGIRRVKDENLKHLLEQVDRQMLHALRLQFRHPRTNAPMDFTAPLARDFSELLRSLPPASFRCASSAASVCSGIPASRHFLDDPPREG